MNENMAVAVDELHFYLWLVETKNMSLEQFCSLSDVEYKAFVEEFLNGDYDNENAK